MSLSPVPSSADLTVKGGATTSPWRSWLEQLYFFVKPLGGNGTTAQRPTFAFGLYVGFQYFDTTLGKPIFVKTVANPPVWVDATGAVV